MVILLGVLSLIWSVFCIILYVRVWKMTEHVKQIRDITFAKAYGIDTLNGVRVGDDVTDKADGKTFKVLGVKPSSNGPVLECGSGLFLVRSQVLSVVEMESIKQKIVVGSTVSFSDGYYKTVGTVNSIDEEGKCTIEVKADSDSRNVVVPIVKLTLASNSK